MRNALKKLTAEFLTLCMLLSCAPVFAEGTEAEVPQTSAEIIEVAPPAEETPSEPAEEAVKEPAPEAGEEEPAPAPETEGEEPAPEAGEEEPAPVPETEGEEPAPEAGEEEPAPVPEAEGEELAPVTDEADLPVVPEIEVAQEPTELPVEELQQPDGTSFELALPVDLGSGASFRIVKGQTVYYQLIDPRTAEYRISLSADIPLSIAVYNESQNALASFDSSPEADDNSFVVQLKSDRVYYLTVSAGDDEGDVSFATARIKKEAAPEKEPEAEPSTAETQPEPAVDDAEQQQDKPEAATEPEAEQAEGLRDIGTPSLSASVSGKTFTYTWSVIPMADGYVLYQSFDGLTWGAIIQITDGRCSTTSYSNVTAGTNYYFMLRSYQMNGGVMTLSGDSNIVNLAAMDNPKIKSFMQTSATSANLQWQTVAGADGYMIYLRYGSTPQWITVPGASVSTYDITGLPDGGALLYADVYAYKGADPSTAAKSGTSGTATCQMLATPTLNSPVSVDSGYSLSWSAVPGAQSYVTYRSTQPSSGFTVLNLGYANSFTDTTAVKGQRYYYRVCAGAFNNIGQYSVSMTSNVVSAFVMAAPTVRLSQVTSGAKPAIRVQWSELSDISGYEILWLYNGVYKNAIVTLAEAQANGREYIIDSLTTDSSIYVYVRGYVTPATGSNLLGPFGGPVSYLLLGTPTLGTCYSAGPNTYVLNWTPVSNCTAYVVYRSTNGNPFYAIGAVSGTSFVDQSLSSSSIYTYMVCAYRNLADGTVSYGPASDKVSTFASATTTLTNVTQVVGSDTLPAARVKWEAVSGVDGYELCWTINGDVQTREVVGATQHTIQNDADPNVTTGNPIAIKIRTYVTNGGVKYYSTYSPTISITLMSKPVIASVTSNEAASTLTVVWSATAGASGYYLYRSSSKDSGYNLLSVLSASSYIDTSVASGFTYYYKVLAYNYPTSAMLSFSPLSDSASGYVFSSPIITNVSQDGADGLNVTFAPVPAAAGYEVMWTMLTTSDTKAMTATEAAANSYTASFTGLTIGEEYSVKARIYTMNGSEKVYSGYSKPIKVSILGQPGIASCTYNAASGTVQLVWNEVKGAYGYLVLRSETRTGPFYGLAFTTSASFANAGIPSGSVYFYQVKPFDYLTVKSATTGADVGNYSYGPVSGTAYVSSGVAIKTLTQTVDTTDAAQPAMKVTWGGNSLFNGYRVSWTINGNTRSEDVPAGSVSYLISHTVDVNVVAGRSISVQLCGYMEDSAGNRTYGSNSSAVSAYILGTPETLTATITSVPSVILNWSAVANASGYTVYRYNSAGVPIALGTSSSTTFIDGTVSTNNVYRYMVAAYTMPTSQTYSFSSGSPIAAAFVVGSATIRAVYQNGEAASAIVSWVKVDNVTGYQLSWVTGDVEKTSDITEATANADGYVHKVLDLNVDTNYIFRIRPYVTYKHPITGLDITVYGNYSTGISLNLLAAPVFSESVTDSVARTNRLTWLASEGASGYRLERSTSDAGPYTVLSYQTGVTYLDSSIIANQTYYYRVSAYYFSVSPTQTVASYSPMTISLPLTAVGAPGIQSVTQPNATSLKVTWQKVPGVTGYNLTWQLATLAEEAQSYMTTEADAARDGYAYAIPNLTPGQKYIVKVRCYITAASSSNTTYSEYSTAYTVPLLQAPTLTAVAGSTNVKLTTGEVLNRNYYLMQRTTNADNWTGSGLYVTANLTETDSGLMRNTTYFYRSCAFAQYGFINGAPAYIYGPYSDIVTVTPIGTLYRALLVGNSTYSGATNLNGPKYDVTNFNTMLRTMNMEDGGAYSSSALNDLTGAEILSSISTAFADAADGDVSLFYYSGHGWSDGSLIGVNATDASGYVSPARLRAKLDTIPGTIVVMLDSCYSGQTIKDGDAARVITSEREAQQMVANFVNAFTWGTTKSGELRASKYKVLVSSAYDQSSYEYSETVDGRVSYYGQFTRQLLRGCGYDLVNRVTTSMYADRDGDGKLTLDELYGYTLNNIGDRQICQVYPMGDTTTIFQRYSN